MDVRRLAALDMHGTRGTRRRRRLILGEFALATAGGAALGAWALTSGGAVGVILGVLSLGIAANYLPLTLHVIALWRQPALDAELAGINLRAELREYSRAQAWLVVPFWVAALALAQARRPA